MQKILMLLCLTMACSACATPRDTRPAAGKVEGGVYAEIDSAVADVAANTSKLIALHAKTDADSAEYWEVAIAHTIPEQPAAVIRLMVQANVPVERMCPREVIEGELSFAEYVQWMESAAAALDAFILDYPREEATRRACLRSIRMFLSNKDQWRY